MAKITKDYGMGPLTIEESEISKYTPDPKQEWLPNEIMVFGSNKQGDHFGGAANYAYQALGAEWGKGEGLSGQTYAFPTLNFATTAKNSNPRQYVNIEHKVSVREFMESFMKLKQCMLDHPELTFYVTKLGLGIAGWDLKTVHTLFWNSGIPFECPNAVYPIEFELPDGQ